MDDGCSSDLELDVSYEAEELEVVQLEHNSSSPPLAGFGNKRANNQPSSSSSKRSRRSVQKRIVSIPISEIEASRAKGGAGEGAPPSDSWTWRKYGQKPIKGSPYPRGYYRCSSSKGCPARKQVERSREDPSTIVVTYSFDHNHSLTHSKKKNSQSSTTTVLSKPSNSIVENPENSLKLEEKGTELSSPESAEKFSEFIGEDCGAFQWLTEGCSTSFDSIFFAESTAAERLPEVAEIGKDEDGLFEGLGELPEWSVVFRRGMTSASWIWSS